MTKKAFERLSRRAIGLVGLAAACMAAGAGQAQSQHRVSIRPYIEIQEGLTSDFNGGDTVTYTGVGGGVDASIATRRVQATISYNYQHQFATSGNRSAGDVHTGLAAVRVDAVPGVVSFDAGAIATRSHDDISRPLPAVRTLNDSNLAQIYGVYGGPSLATHAGALAINGAYRLGYVHVNDQGPDLAPAGTPRVPRYDSSTVQEANASIGMDPRHAPIGWTIGAGWDREDMNRLDSKYDGKYVRGDVVVPVSSGLAVTGGVGYEKIRASQQDFVRDAVGNPVLTRNGNLVGDPVKPRIDTFDTSGLIWDVGVIWRPGPRTEFQARGGRRYGSTTVTGSFQYKFKRNYAFSAYVYDNVSSFGRLLIADLGSVPTHFKVPGPGAGTGFGGCVFGVDAGSGSCFDNALQSLNNFNFRNRGGGVMLSGGRGPWSFGIGAGYANHRYLAPPGAAFTLNGVTEQSFTVDAGIQRKLGRTSGIDFDAFAAWYDSGITGTPGSSSAGITASYYRSFLTERLQGNITGGIYNSHGDHFDSTFGSLLLGLRYTF